VSDPQWRLGEPAAPEQSWDAVVLIDSHPTMQVWSAVTDHIAEQFQRVGYSRLLVRGIELGLGTDTSALADAGDSAGSALPPVFLLSDGAAPAWTDGSAESLLRQIATRQPTAVVHMLPINRWHLTGLQPEAAEFGALLGRPNSSWQWRPAATATSLEAPADLGVTVAVPVIEMRWLNLFSRMLKDSQSPRSFLPALLLAEAHDGEDQVSVRLAPDVTSSPKATVDEFRASVSPLTFQLAKYLAAVPLDWDVIRHLQTRLLPDSTPKELAEILVSPLVYSRAQPEAQAGPSLHFVDGVQEELLATSRRSDIQRVVRTLSDRASDAPGVGSLIAVLEEEEAPGQSTLEVDAIWREARVKVLQALGGRFARRGAQEALELIAAGVPEGRYVKMLEPLEPGALQAKSRDVERQVPVGSGPEDSYNSQNALTDRDRSAEGHAKGQDMSIVNGTQQQDAEAGQQPASGHRPVLGSFPLRNPNFTGRRALLSQLYDSLRSRQSAAVLPHALHGMGGVGKSLLAIEYIYLHQSEYDVIWWVQARRTPVIQSSLVELGQQLGLGAGIEANTAPHAVLDALRRGHPYANWLLVFDNAHSPSQVAPLSRRVGQGMSSSLHATLGGGRSPGR